MNSTIDWAFGPQVRLVSLLRPFSFLSAVTYTRGELRTPGFISHEERVVDLCDDVRRELLGGGRSRPRADDLDRPVPIRVFETFRRKAVDSIQGFQGGS